MVRGTRLYLYVSSFTIHLQFIAVCSYKRTEGGTQLRGSYRVTDSYRRSSSMTDFTCKVDGRYRSVCEDFPQYKDTGYRVLHYPAEKDSEEFRQAVQAKLGDKNYDFRGCYFPEGIRYMVQPTP